MRKYPIHPPKDVGQMPLLLVLRVLVSAHGQPRRKGLWRREEVGSPVECVAAVVDGAARLRRLVDGAQVLPLGCAHLGTSDGGARRAVGEESDNERVHFLCEKAAQLVEPKRPIHVLRRLG